MYLLIEGYNYDVSIVSTPLRGLYDLEDINHKVCVNYVGYYYNGSINDCVFILPKVLLDVDDKVFGHSPEEILHVSASPHLTLCQHDFIYGFAVWIYRAISLYARTHPANEIVFHRHLGSIHRGRITTPHTLLDVILALLHWHREHHAFVLYTLQRQHSGINTICWHQTISHTRPLFQSTGPIYVHPITRHKEIDFDEELLVIFYSILRYIHQHYGFPVDTDLQFTLIPDAVFKHYLNGFGVKRLRAIRYKYFSDTSVELWELCYSFFEQYHSGCLPTSHNDYLLVKDFNIVFEAMIDHLIGDQNLPLGLKAQRDGKLVDHIYQYRPLLDNENTDIYYLGDSKYYKCGNTIVGESVYKQYTYTRNVIQWNIDLFSSGEQSSTDVCLRDEVTEGYNIIPNFFISAFLASDLSYIDDGLEEVPTDKWCSTQFNNRLFDRDTLLLSHYNVNFLFVLRLYARNKSSEISGWRNRVRADFRDKIRSRLSQDYSFYAMQAHPTIHAPQYIRDHFQAVIGKTYRPFVNKDIYSLALDSSREYEEGNKQLLSLLHTAFDVVECPLGTNPISLLPPVISTIRPVYTSNIDMVFVLYMIDKDINQNSLALLDGTGNEFVSCDYADPIYDLTHLKFLAIINSQEIKGYYEIMSNGIISPFRMRYTLGEYHPLTPPKMYPQEELAKLGIVLTFEDFFKLENSPYE